MSESSPKPGTVYLVGGGPGDPGLITLRGVECLRRADVVLYDGLVNPLLLRHTSAHATRTSRASGPGGMRLNQDEINEQLIAEAKRGRTVVRLKGGDPLVFGRGGEEAAALREAGIPFEIVPGITAATAVGAYAGISVTHRKHASAVALVTGHEDPAKPDSALDYENLAAFPGTLVFYMGLHRLPRIAESLVASGKTPATPACVVSRGTTAGQREVSGRLDTIAMRVAEAGLHAPSLFIVGEVVAPEERLEWFVERPLFGLRIGVTRPEGQADGVIARCLELGAEPVPMPTIRILPPDDMESVDSALARLNSFDWIVFTSANGVHGLLGRLWEQGGDVRRIGSAKIATIGPGTAETLAEYRLRADLVPDEYRAEALAAALGPLVTGKRVLWARANRGRDVLSNELAAAGAELETVVVYRNEDATEFDASVRSRLIAGEIDWIGLSSPSIARNLADLVPPESRGHLGTSIKLASISPVTSAAAAEVGFPIATEATEFTWNGILEAISDRHSAVSRGEPSTLNPPPSAP